AQGLDDAAHGEAGLRAAGDRPDATREGDDAEPVARGGEIGERRPFACAGTQRPDSALRALGRLAADRYQAPRDGGGPGAAAGVGQVQKTRPPPGARIERLDRPEVRVDTGEPAADRIHAPGKRRRGEMLAGSRAWKGAPAERAEIEGEGARRQAAVGAPADDPDASVGGCRRRGGRALLRRRRDPAPV